MKNINILHLDGSAGLAVGVLLLIFHDWVSTLYNMHSSVVLFITAANILYGLCALSLAIHFRKTPLRIGMLAIANAIWAIVCVNLIVQHINTASLIGLAFICLEGCFVVFLAIFEWKQRYVLP